MHFTSHLSVKKRGQLANGIAHPPCEIHQELRVRQQALVDHRLPATAYISAPAAAPRPWRRISTSLEGGGLAPATPTRCGW